MIMRLFNQGNQTISTMFKLLPRLGRPNLTGFNSFQTNFCFGFRKRFIDFAIKQNEAAQKLKAQSPLSQPTEDIKKTEQMLSQEDKKIINTYKVDKMWNLILKQPLDHNFQKDLIIYRKQFQNSTKELRSAILFEDLLKTQIDITIYDTKGKPYAHYLLKFFYMLFTVGAAVWSVQALREFDPKNAVMLDRTTMGKIYKGVVYFLSAVLFLVTMNRYSDFRRRYVQRIIYNTQRQQFTFIKRNFIGLKYNYVASRFKILYTQNRYLNKLGTNYFDIDTKEEFSIAYKDSWVKQDLFSHLISQRIKI